MLERCELCNLVLPPVHRHLLDMETRQVEKMTIRMTKLELLSENEASAHARFRTTAFWFPAFVVRSVTAYCGGMQGIAG